MGNGDYLDIMAGVDEVLRHRRHKLPPEVFGYVGGGASGRIGVEPHQPPSRRPQRKGDSNCLAQR